MLYEPGAAEPVVVFCGQLAASQGGRERIEQDRCSRVCQSTAIEVKTAGECMMR